LTNVDTMFAHYTATCAKLVDGHVVCWGRNTEGQLGDPSFHNRDFAAPIGVTCP
jgi:alpha-tubulin suppressor-like RCC1 family protein